MSESAIASNPNETLEIVKVSYFYPEDGSVIAADPGVGNFVYAEGIQSISHGLSFTPLVMAFLYDSLGYPIFGGTGGGILGAGIAQWDAFEVYSDATNIYFITKWLSLHLNIAFGYGSEPNLVKIKYYLLREKVV